eukprot:NODE_4671_length_456_cov_5.867322_g4030_i0.p1 GENE.NODE_4671_length_456_cov_5.867322_g4030_i0~~NODE_4671_length_456_cov_5.867322_g4030_i0.p1  ORF type:complete len:73 (-),score=13.80 NODE_4671_length_456_cov_5.867322_g4030_i0:51-269(-)
MNPGPFSCTCSCPPLPTYHRPIVYPHVDQSLVPLLPNMLPPLVMCVTPLATLATHQPVALPCPNTQPLPLTS